MLKGWVHSWGTHMEALDGILDSIDVLTSGAFAVTLIAGESLISQMPELVATGGGVTLAMMTGIKGYTTYQNFAN